MRYEKMAWVKIRKKMAISKKILCRVRNAATPRRFLCVRLLRTCAVLVRNTVLRGAFPRHSWGVRRVRHSVARKWATVLSEA